MTCAGVVRPMTTSEMLEVVDSKGVLDTQSREGGPENIKPFGASSGGYACVEAGCKRR